MAVLVTRPHPDNEVTARSLRERGFEVVLAPMLRFEALPLADDIDTDFAAVIVTSANALRAVEAQLEGFLKLPLFAVGEHTASEARRLGFGQVISAEGDAGKLRDLLRKSLKSKKAKRLLYLAGNDLSRDLAGALGERGFEVVTRYQACRARPATPSPPTKWKRCCTIPNAARAPSWRRRGRRGSKSQRSRCHNAVFRPMWPRSCARPARCRCWPPPPPTKMPCSGHWSVLCGPDWRKKPADSGILYLLGMILSETGTDFFRIMPPQAGNRRDGR